MPEDETALETPLSGSSSASSARPSFSATSFVYPVRSLLTAIQPAVNLPRSRSTDTVSSLSDSLHDLRHTLRRPDSASDAAEHTPSPAVTSSEALNKVFAFPDPQPQTPEQPGQLSGTSQSRRRTLSSSCMPFRSPLQPSSPSSYHIPPASHYSPPESASSPNLHKPKASGKMSSVNYRHFPAEEGDPNVPRTFSTTLPPELVPSVPLNSEPESQSDGLDYSSIPLPLVASHALTATSASLLPSATSPPLSASSANSLSPQEKTPSLVAVAEIEHPIYVKDFALEPDSSSALPELAQEQPSELPEGEKLNTPKSFLSADVDLETRPPENPAPAGNTQTSEVADKVPDLPYNLSQCGLVHLPPLPSPGHTDWCASGEYVTFRFKYVMDENGNHVVAGREGKLQRCEDEPIRTPGAVQGFGVLIAVEDTEETLVVRQVSENATEILGLSPRYLFSLECFTDTLPESSAGLLWDNIQFLTDPTYIMPEDEDTAPHVFVISASSTSSQPDLRRYWTCWCAVHRAQTNDESKPGLIVMEFELESDTFNPLYPPVSGHSGAPPASQSSDAASDTPFPAIAQQSSRVHPTTWSHHTLAGLEGQGEWTPSAEDILASTTNYAKPLPALERLRRLTQRVGMMDVFAVMAQINEQLGAAQDLDQFLKVTVGIIKDLTQFHRVLVYQFDEAWNGQTVAELVDWGVTRDLYRGLHFPASDIPRQARELYMINKVRVLYDRSQPTARIVVKDKADLEEPLNMTHCYLRAMSPIHLKYLENMGVRASMSVVRMLHTQPRYVMIINYLENMGVRASMSVSIMAFDQLWGLVACHSYGNSGMRVSFPVRQMLRLLSQSISRNIERLSYAQRLHTRKLINTLSSDRHPTGYIVSNADDLLGLFDADFGILVIGEGAKILGPNQHGQEILIMAEYLRLKQFDTIQASQAVINDFSDLRLTTGFEVIAGLLYVPLSSGGKDFIAFLRRGQLRDVHWAGKPFKNTSHGAEASLEPRKSFKIWSETVAGRCRAWTDEQLETAGVLALVYGKFIEVWRQKQSALQTTKLTNLLLSNATHEVRTPLNHIINYLEMAMNGPLDGETRDNLVRSHAASKSLLFTINDLLDLTRLESGNETSFNEPFDLRAAIEDAVHIYRKEASRRNLEFVLDVSNSPQTVVGDSRKIRTVVQNLTANALKYTETGTISVSCKPFDEPEGLRSPKQTAVEIIVADTGCGIEGRKLEKIFREFEQVEFSEPRSNAEAGVGLGLAVVARIVEQLGGQLRADSKVQSGSRFSFLIPLALTQEGSDASQKSPGSSIRSQRSQTCSRPASMLPSRTNEIDGLVEALATSHMSPRISPTRDGPLPPTESGPLSPRIITGGSTAGGRGTFEVKDSGVPLRPVKVDYFDQEVARTHQAPHASLSRAQPPPVEGLSEVSVSPNRPRFHRRESRGVKVEKLRILIVEDNDINRTILAKRLTLTGHTVVNATNGQEGIDIIKNDDGFDAVLMDMQMPIVNGFEATQQIRALESENIVRLQMDRVSHRLNGRIPIFAVSASLMEQQREELISYGMDGWILKPIDFKRLNLLLKGVTDVEQRKRDIYRLGGSWEVGGWLEDRLDH
ncbi:Cyanobacterial phytochrome B [Leucoagaricus sp. SymC.cos]|nr:Cyanobacterial phytochrome B [Leucoagaricus sp. SymC.cos]